MISEACMKIPELALSVNSEFYRRVIESFKYLYFIPFSSFSETKTGDIGPLMADGLQNYF